MVVLARIAPTSRMTATSLGKTPTTRARRLKFLVHSLERVGAPDLWLVRSGHAVNAQHVPLGRVHQRADFGSDEPGIKPLLEAPERVVVTTVAC
jgi:hypothetical protein